MRDIILPGTPQWFEARNGSWTASRAPTLMSTTKRGDSSAKLSDLIGDIAAERHTGSAARHFVTDPMQRGIDLEPHGADAYSLRQMVVLGESRLVLHPKWHEKRFRVCATPDRFVGEDGLVEIKCPTVRLKHLDTLMEMSGKPARKSLTIEYRDQVQWQLWVTGRAWCDLVSYYPEFPPRTQLAIVRIEPDPERFEAFERAIEAAEEAVAEILDTLETITTGQREAAE